ncbi:MAG: S9 family peptidase [Proteobacteria bacterium]|nr:S9 family peptidase [Pseudomonadota bacterium]
MKNKGCIVMFLSALMLISCAGSQPAPENAVQTQAEPQPAKIVPAPAPDNHPGNDVVEFWGEKVPDPYRWLEDASQEGVQSWIKSQDTRSRDYLAQMPMREHFEKRLSELLYVSRISGMPMFRDNRMFYFERAPKDESATLYVRDLSKPDAAPRVLIDPSKLSEDGSIALGDINVSPDGRFMTYKLHPNNADQGTMYVMIIETGEILSDKLENTNLEAPAWLKDSSGFYYIYYPFEQPDKKFSEVAEVRFHKVGKPQNEDKVIIGPPDAGYFSLSDDGLWFINDHRIRRANSDGEWLVLPDIIKYDIDKYKSIVSINQNALFFLTNDKASRYRIIKIDLSADTPDLSEHAWQTIIPEFKDRVIEDFMIVNDKLFVMTIKDVVNYLDVYDLNGKWLKSIEMPDKGTIFSMSGAPESNALYVGFTSYKIDKIIYKIDTQSLNSTIWLSINDQIHPENIIVEQVFATSKDGTKVPIFVLRHKNTKLDGTAKTILHGYGAQGVIEKPFIQRSAYSWLEQGGIYAHAVIRGGGEYGENWHQDGIGLKRQNSFDDYYAAAEYLIANKYTRPSSLAANGASNGGLLVGVALTQRPDLYGAIICEDPILDMLQSSSKEYGNPKASEAEFKYLKGYSPYHNVKKTAYPSVLFLSADSDNRANPMHARKMTAAVQGATTSNNPVLLRIEKNAGHHGAGTVRSVVEENADVYSFLMYVLE